MSKEYEALKLKVYILERKYKRCKELLRDSEWITVNGKSRCLFCKGEYMSGHADDCELAKALGLTDQEEVTA